MRFDAELSETGLAAVLGLTETAIRHYERGRRVPSVARLAAVAEALGCSMGDLLEANPPDDARAISKVHAKRSDASGSGFAPASANRRRRC